MSQRASSRSSITWPPPTARYAYTRDLSPSGWAWEFLRRNPQLRADAGRARGSVAARRRTAMACRQADGSLWILGKEHLPQAEAWGLELFPDPDKTGAETTPFWLPGAIGGDLEAVMEPPAGLVVELFPVDAVPQRKTVLVRIGERVRMTVEGPRYSEILGSPMPARYPNDAIEVALTVPGQRGFDAHLVRMRRFFIYCHGARREAALVSTPAAERLCDVLIALDGRRAGLSYRDIALAFYDEDRIREDWSGAASLKERMRRLVRRGEALTAGRYRDLLRRTPASVEAAQPGCRFQID